MSEPKKLSELSTIEKEDVKDALISGLRSRPNAKSLYGAKGLTANELKEQYDKYPEILRQHFNELVEAIVESLKNDDGNGSKLAEEIMVIVSEPDSLPIYTNNLKNAIQEMIGNIKTALYTADNAETTAGAARLTANEAKETADEAKNIADEAKETANEAEQSANNAVEASNEAKAVAVNAANEILHTKEVSQEAKEASENAVEKANAAQSTADEALSVSKGANRAETFDNVDQMNAWINARKEEVEADGVTGKTVPAGSTLIYSVANNPEGLLIDGASLSAIVSLNNNEIVTRATVEQGRAYCLVCLTEETYIESFEAQILYSNGTDSIYCSENPRKTYVEGSPDIINYDHIKSHNIAVGKNLYISIVGVPDYWWDGSKAQELETQKVNLIEYAKKEFVAENYVAKPTDGKSWGVYVRNETSTGEWIDKLMVYSATEIWPLTLVQRDKDGHIHTINPWLPEHVTNKGYVDKLRDAVVKQCLFKSTDTAFSKSVYVHSYENGTHSDMNIELTPGSHTTGLPACDAWTVPRRYRDGGLIVPKNPYGDCSATSKSYVDTKFATLEARIAELEAAQPEYITVASVEELNNTTAEDGTIAIIVNLISFTIDGTSYQAEDGMTWSEWVGSDYNTGGAFTSDYDVFLGVMTFVSTDGTFSNRVRTSDEIIVDHNYITYYDSGSN